MSESKSKAELVAMRLRLQTHEAVTLPPDQGRAAYWFLMRWLDTYDSDLVADLREPNQLRPFTVSNILCPTAQYGRGGRRLNAGDMCYMRVTGFKPHIVAALDTFCSRAPKSVLIGDTVFDVVGVDIGADTTIRTGRTSYHALLEESFYADDAVSSVFALRFLSPTGFKTDRQELPLPVPDLVFGSLLNRWNAFAPGPLPEDSRLFAGTNLRLGRCQIETHPVVIDGSTRFGFTGYAQFKALNKERFYLRTLQTLCAFGFFSGVGYETTAGMGQVEIRVKETLTTSRISL